MLSVTEKHCVCHLQERTLRPKRLQRLELKAKEAVKLSHWEGLGMSYVTLDTVI